MIGEELGGEISVSTCDAAAARNLMLAVERCHLRVAAIVASPYAAGLSTLVDDEAELGAALIDFGGGATTMAAFANDRLAHVDSVPVGGRHVTMDIARGLSVSLADAERLKTHYGACVATPADERETLSIHRVGDELDRPTHISRSELTRIIRPRVEEILELARDRLAAAGFAAHAGRSLILTGGASQLAGLADLTRAIVSAKARMGRPLGVEGLPGRRQDARLRHLGRADDLPAGGGARAFRRQGRRGAGRGARRRLRGARPALAEAEFLRGARERPRRGGRSPGLKLWRTRRRAPATRRT